LLDYLINGLGAVFCVLVLLMLWELHKSKSRLKYVYPLNVLARRRGRKWWTHPFVALLVFAVGFALQCWRDWN
jgi:hypothetical protein